MSIYLYVKTHNTTGLKYLGQTKNIDPHRYPGSGKHWIRHLRKHGNNFTTEIIKECRDVNEVNYWGQYYSTLWNVVDSKEWANLKPETGDGGSGPMAEETKRKISKSNTGKHKGIKRGTEHPDTARKRSKALSGKTYEEIYGIEKAQELRKKRSESMKGMKIIRNKPLPKKPVEKPVVCCCGYVEEHSD